MKRKNLLALLTAVCLMSSLVGCGGQSSQSADVSSEPQDADKVYTISIGSISAETLPEVRAAMAFEKEVEEKSNGRIDVSVYPNGQLGGDRQMVEAIELGTLDIAMVPTSVLTTYDKQFGILDMPFAFSDAQKAFNAVDGDLGTYLNGVLSEKSSMYNLGYLANGVRHMVNGQKPINEPADMAGMKMRIMESPIYESMFKALGANPTPMSFGDVYTSLQQNVIDGFECSANFIYDMKFYEIQDYFSLTAHTVSLLAVPINKDKYDSLPEDLRAIVDEGVANMINSQREMTVGEDADYMEKLVECGMQINEISPKNHEKFVEAVSPLYSQYEAEFGGDIFDMLRQYQ